MGLPLGFKHSDSTRQKIRLANLGRPSPNKGKKLSEERVQKMKKAQQARRLRDKGVGWVSGGPKYNKIYQREYQQKYRHSGKQREYLQKLRALLLEGMGGKCVSCGFSDFRALQVDHVNGGGSKERKERSYRGSFHKHVLASFKKEENIYQLLCANCNWIKRFEKKEATGNRLDTKKGV